MGKKYSLEQVQEWINLYREIGEVTRGVEYNLSQGIADGLSGRRCAIILLERLLPEYLKLPKEIKKACEIKKVRDLKRRCEGIIDHSYHAPMI